MAFKTLYNWLYSSRLNQGKLQVLRHKGKRRKPPEKRGCSTLGPSIQQRPKEIHSRETFGHWELDTVVFSRGKSKACVASFVERKTRFYQAIKMPNRTAISMEIAFGVLAAQYPKAAIQTATVDRAKNWPAMPCSSSSMVWRFTLPIRILPGSEVPTRMRTDGFESFSQRP
ncbi:IS30 family transposase [Paenibacillus sp. Z6-24]